MHRVLRRSRPVPPPRLATGWSLPWPPAAPRRLGRRRRRRRTTRPDRVDQEDLPDRVAATQAIVDAFTEESGVTSSSPPSRRTSSTRSSPPTPRPATCPTSSAASRSARSAPCRPTSCSTPTPSPTCWRPSTRHVQRERAGADRRRRHPAGDPERVVDPAARLPQGPLRGGRPRRAHDVRRHPGRRRGPRQPRPRRLRRRQRAGRRLHRADDRGDRPGQRLPAGRRGGRGHLRQRPVRRGARLLRSAHAELHGLRCAGRRHHAGVVLRRPGRDDHLVDVHPRRDGGPAERRPADLPRVQEGPRLPGQEQRRRHRDPGPVGLGAGDVRRGDVVGDRRGRRPARPRTSSSTS